jgi:hypothetical protein
VVGAALLANDHLLHWTARGQAFLTRLQAATRVAERVLVANHVEYCVVEDNLRKVWICACDGSEIAYEFSDSQSDGSRAQASLDLLLTRLTDMEQHEHEIDVESERVNKRIKTMISAMNFKCEAGEDKASVARFAMESHGKWGFTIGQARRVVLLDVCLLPKLQDRDSVANAFKATIVVDFRWGSWSETQSRICVANGRHSEFEFDLSSAPMHLRSLPLHISANAWFSLEHSGFGTHLTRTRFDVLDWANADFPQDQAASLQTVDASLAWIDKTCAFHMNKLKIDNDIVYIVSQLH